MSNVFVIKDSFLPCGCRRVVVLQSETCVLLAQVRRVDVMYEGGSLLFEKSNIQKCISKRACHCSLFVKKSYSPLVALVITIAYKSFFLSMFMRR